MHPLARSTPVQQTYRRATVGMVHRPDRGRKKPRCLIKNPTVGRGRSGAGEQAVRVRAGGGGAVGPGEEAPEVPNPGRGLRGDGGAPSISSRHLPEGTLPVAASRLRHGDEHRPARSHEAPAHSIALGRTARGRPRSHTLVASVPHGSPIPRAHGVPLPARR